MASQVDFELLVVAGKNLAKEKISGVNMRFVDWSEEGEAEFLSGSHVGIMPLTDDKFSRGKSAFKLIQYFAAGLPVIASPVGENVKVVKDGVNGFLAETGEEWLDALGKLYLNRAFYSRMALAAKRASVDFSLEKYSPIMVEFIRRTFGNGLKVLDRV
jgi:glycosyltransferase involved in cell wall biosynthesis